MSNFDFWDTYERIVGHDYMCHREITLAYGEVLRRSRTHSVLDLGCGDASVFVRASRGLPVAHYRGVDQSEDAIGRAERHLSLSGDVPFDLVCRDLMGFVENHRGARYTDIVLGYVLHHFSLPEKRKVLHRCRELMESEGTLFLFDVARRAGETSYAAYHERLCREIDGNWDGLSIDERSVVKEHIRQWDFPEGVDETRKLIEEAGFEKVSLRFRDAAEFYVVFAATRG